MDVEVYFQGWFVGLWVRERSGRKSYQSNVFMRPNSRPCCRPQKFVSYPLSLILSIIYLCIGLILFVFIWVHSILILAQLSPNFPYPCVRTNPSHPFVFLIFTIHSKSQTLKALKDLLFFSYSVVHSQPIPSPSSFPFFSFLLPHLLPPSHISIKIWIPGNPFSEIHKFAYS